MTWRWVAMTWVAMTAGLCLAACAGPSPQVQVAAADASQPATADSSATGQATANESAAAAAMEPKADSADASASEAASAPAAAADEEPKPDSTQAVAPPTSEAVSSPAATADEEPKPESADGPASAVSEAAAPTATADNATPPPAPPPEPQATSDAAPPPPPPPAAETTQTAAAPQPEQPQSTGGVAAPGSGLATGRPYVVIRFTESNVDYEKALSEAVKRAVARKPNLAFDLVAVTPRAGTAEELADLTEQAHAEAAAVMKSLSNLGIGPERVSIMTWTGQPTDVNEIRLYIR